MELINKDEVLKIIDEAGDLGEAHGDINCNCNVILTIPDNPTNGDILRAIFPSASVEVRDISVYIKVGDCAPIGFNRKLWDAPYKEHIDEKCDFCECHTKGDDLYELSGWDGGIGFDYIRNIKYCPLCGRELEV